MTNRKLNFYFPFWTFLEITEKLSRISNLTQFCHVLLTLHLFLMKILLTVDKSKKHYFVLLRATISRVFLSVWLIVAHMANQHTKEILSLQLFIKLEKLQILLCFTRIENFELSWWWCFECFVYIDHSFAGVFLSVYFRVATGENPRSKDGAALNPPTQRRRHV